MKTSFISSIFCVCLSIALVACDPIENTDDQKSYGNAGEAMTSAELDQYITVTQLPNVDGEIAGDQYIIVKNSRPDIGGTWILSKDGVNDVYGTDGDTLIASSNGTYTIFYRGIYNNKVVTSTPRELTVTNVFDEYDNLLTGAKNKADRNAVKTWKFRKVEVKSGKFSYANMGAYGGWKYTSAGYTPESDFIWWANITDAELGDKVNWRMEFSYNGNKFTVYDTNGTVQKEGTFRYTHNEVDKMVLGELITSQGLMGSEFDETGPLKGYWILTLDANHMTLFHPSTYTGGVDWSDYGWYVYYESE